mmetsp:Transcript_39246/g.118034  ORF Transcript_39246/g.118034 Transcript_39246/m.118034 type:complete len:333 (-) Transcript_39246:135-1133(-)
MGFPIDLFTEPVDDSFICGVCRDVFDGATNLNVCGHAFCRGCINAAAGADPKCPICRKVFDCPTHSNPNYTVNDLIGKMTIRCKNHSAAASEEEEKMPAAKKPRAEASACGDSQEVDSKEKGCGWVGKVSDWYDHAENECPWEETTCPVKGCRYTCARKDMEKHTQSSLQKHMELGIEARVEAEVEKRVAELRRDFSAQLERFRVQINASIPIQPPKTVVVSGAGTNLVNGLYKRKAAVSAMEMATNGASFVYVKASRSDNRHERYTISPTRLRGGHTFWYICVPDQEHPGSDRDVDFYRAHSDSSTPPDSKWEIAPNGHGQLPLPQIEYQF